MFSIKYADLLNKELLLMEYGNLLKMKLFLIMRIIKLKEYNKLRFSSNLDLPLDTLIEFRALTFTISCVIEKDGKYYPEIYLDEGLYVQNY